jgi:hypothetical protein
MPEKMEMAEAIAGAEGMVLLGKRANGQGRQHRREDYKSNPSKTSGVRN